MSKKLCPTCEHPLNLVDVHAGGSVRHCMTCGTMTIGTDRHVPTLYGTLADVCNTVYVSLGGVMADLVALDADSTVNVCASLELLRRQLAGAVAKAERGG